MKSTCDPLRVPEGISKWHSFEEQSGIALEKEALR